ncbi:MAG: restriction endonuclease subunit S [Deltaproteobacteria bacterium]|nr:restriction endonuclease subunit S [Deltaproteobacteria bacterium]
MAEHYAVPDELHQGTPLDGAVWQFGRLDPMPPAVPRGWRLVRLTTVARLESGHTPSRREPSWWGGTVPWVSLGDTDRLDDPVIVETSENINERGLANSSARVLPGGTVVVSRTATVGKVTILGHDMATSQDFANYVCGPEVHNVYLMQLLRFMQPEWRRLRAGSTHNTVYMPVFKSLQVLLPPLDEQRRIAVVLSAMDTTRSRQEAVLLCLRTARAAIAAHLFARDGWETTRLADVLAPGRGSCVGGPFGSDLTRKDYVQSGVPVLRGSNMPVSGVMIDEREFAYVTEAKARSLERNLAFPGDVVFTQRGTLGQVGLLPLDSPHPRFLLSQSQMKATLDVAKIDRAFALHWFKSEFVQDWIRVHTTGTGVPHINLGTLREFPVLLPPLSEQRRIAVLLSAVDAYIARTMDGITATAKLKSALAHRLLTGATA